MQPFTAEDLYLHRSLQGIDASTAHDTVVFVLSRPDKAGNRYRSTIRLLHAARPERSRQLTTPAFNASSPRLSPDAARVAFLSDRGDDGMQVHVMPLDGGESRQVGHVAHRLQGIQGWSADARRLLLSVRVPWAEDERDDAGNKAQRPYVVKFLPWKQDGGTPLVGFRTHLMALDVDSGEETGLVQGDFEATEGRWSPDGRHLAFVRYRGGRQRHLCDVWLARADGSEARQLTRDIASVGSVRWSPDSRRIAFSGSVREGDSLKNLFVLDLDGTAPRRLGDDALQVETGVVWHPDGDRIAVVATRNGLQEIVVAPLDGDAGQPLPIGLRHVTDVQASQDGLVFVASNLRQPDELYTLDWTGNTLRRRSAFNRGWVSQRTRPRVSKRKFRVRDGDGEMGTVEAWLLRPPGQGPFPLLLDLHGGPHSAALIDFPSHVYCYLLCSNGWAVLAPNAAGSSGYGSAFARKLRGRWGELDLPQHLGIIDILREEGIADERLAVTGKSYGGYLAAWAIGHSDRFKAAVVSAPVANVESHTGTSDTGFYVTPYAMDGEISDVRDRYRALSPVNDLDKARTPTLLLQGEDDQRCPLGQSEELLAHLIRCSDAPVEMVVYPGGSHALAATGRPDHRVDYHSRLVAWVRRWAENSADG